MQKVAREIIEDIMSLKGKRIELVGGNKEQRAGFWTCSSYLAPWKSHITSHMPRMHVCRQIANPKSTSSIIRQVSLGDT